MAEPHVSGSVTSARIKSKVNFNLEPKIVTTGASPRKVLVFPKDICQEARIVTLKDPRFFTDSRYLVCPIKGIFEFRDLSALEKNKRSWFLSPDDNFEAYEEDLNETLSSTKAGGYVIQNANLLIATAIDPLFIILPALAPNTKSSVPLNNLFLSEDEYLERLTSFSPQFDHFTGIGSVKITLSQRMAVVCDMVEADSEKMYRLNYEKLLQELVNKAKRMVTKGLPLSMEEKLIRRPLESSTFYEKYGEALNQNAVQGMDNLRPEPLSDGQLISLENSSSSNESSRTPKDPIALDSSSIHSLSDTYQEQSSAPNRVADLLRLRTSLFFILSNYVAPHISETLTKLLLNSSHIADFGPLDSRLGEIAKLRNRVQDTRLTDDFSRKRSRLSDQDDEIQIGKRKKENEGKKRQAGGRSGTNALRKVDVSGMKKMSDFFKKK